MVVVPFVRVVIDAVVRPWSRRKGNMPIGFLEQAALRREPCNMTIKVRISVREASQRCPLQCLSLLKHVSAALNTHSSRGIVGGSVL
jgi:hypothetical protein